MRRDARTTPHKPTTSSTVSLHGGHPANRFDRRRHWTARPIDPAAFRHIPGLYLRHPTELFPKHLSWPPPIVRPP